MEQMRHETPESFQKAMADSKAAGHQCLVAHEPRLRCFGYIDHTTGTHHLISVTLLGPGHPRLLEG